MSKKKLKIIDRPMLGRTLAAPPAIVIDENGTICVCPRCDTHLLTVRAGAALLLLRCGRCGTISTTRGI